MMEALLCLITLFSLLAVTVTLGESISIDCGSTGSYVDSNNVTWVGDKGFVTNGEPMKIPDVVKKPINTLRYFPTGQTNCYTNIPVTKGQKTLVRTKFYYENYDAKFSPPSFDVIYDGKHRDSIVITESLLNDEETFYFSEVIYVPENKNISVCLLRTSPSDNPFISSIEVYSLDTGMYDDLGPNEGLILHDRIAYGAKELISYPLDPYGRVWLALGSQDSTLTDLTTSAPSIDITGASNKPPEIVMSKALSGVGLVLSDQTLPLTGVPVYLVLYFSEPQSLGRTQRRSFNVFLDNTQVGSRPIVPVFGKATQFILRDVVATSASQIVFQSTDDSVLPPLINGLELYSISNTSPDSGGGGGDQGGGSTDDSEGSGGAKQAKNLGKGGAKSSGGKKNNKLPLILGVTFASAFAVLASAFAAIWKKRQNAKSQSNSTVPNTSTEHGAGTGMSPLVGQQFASDMSDSYVAEDGHH
ncbi:putative Malectin-like domain-containing protein [Arabidopsis thaliana]|nr:Malectin-like domain [Arabidopsis thaliana x Arabidopsis arenosa]